MGPTWDSNRSSLSISCMYSLLRSYECGPETIILSAHFTHLCYVEGKEWGKTGPQVEYLLVTMRVKKGLTWTLSPPFSSKSLDNPLNYYYYFIQAGA